jgi:hypothetical protein
MIRRLALALALVVPPFAAFGQIVTSVPYPYIPLSPGEHNVAPAIYNVEQ